MEDFNSKYTGEDVEQLLDQVANGEVGGETLTEADIANMGFTKNQGTITEVKMNGVSKGTSGVVDLGNVQTPISDLETIREGAAKGATALQSVPSEYVTEDELLWVKAEGESGVRLKGTNGTATGNLAISAGDEKTASDGTLFTSEASGDHAVVFGYGNTCAGRTTLAQGLYNTVNGKDSVAFGQRNLVDGDQAFAVGQQNKVTARLGVTLGYQNKATNINSVAIGYKNISGGSGSVALGDNCESNGTSSTAMGYKTKATGAYSSTFGENTQATNKGEVAMGLYNKSTTSSDASEQTLFSFGIGTSDTNRLNAFEIKKNGDVYIGDELLNIPSAVTESTVSGWGFTKNTGTYSKPSTGIPKTDLASDVQSALDNAVTREQIGDMEVIQTQGFNGSLSDTLYALPDEATGEEDDILLSKNTVKTINGQSIFGSGNITIEGGGSSGGESYAGNYPVVNHGTSDIGTSREHYKLSPNTFHIWGEVTTLYLEKGNAVSGANEYLFQFTSGMNPTTLTWRGDDRWGNNEAPVIESGYKYQISILEGVMCFTKCVTDISTIDPL